MELTLANAISNIFVLGFKSLFRDLEYFFSSALFFLQFLPTRGSSSLGVKMQISSTSGPKVSCNKNVLEGEKAVQIVEFNMVMGRLGLVGWMDGNGQKSNLGREDFLDMFVEEEPSFDEIKEAFEVFDVNKDGFIDAFELQNVVCKLGLKEGCSLEECKRMIKCWDCNGDGVIDFHEFVMIMEKCLC